MDNTLKIIGSILGILIPVAGFIYQHFKTINAFKDQINQLKLDMKELEKRDDLQQSTIDQLKELYPIIKTAFEKLNRDKK